jgi:hypothetical protein
MSDHDAARLAWTCRLLMTCGLLVLSAGCHKKVAVIAPVVLPAPAPELVATVPVPVAVPLPTPEPVSPRVAINPGPLPPALTPPKPVPPSRTPQPTRPAPAPAPVTPAPVTPVPVPALAAILGADERKKLDAQYQADLRQATRVLNGLRGHTLNPTQTDAVERARAFISEAAEYHDRDLATAAELARRARVLTQDLAGAH